VTGTTVEDAPVEEAEPPLVRPSFGPRAMLLSAAAGCAIGVTVTLAFAPLAMNHHGRSTPTPGATATSIVPALAEGIVRSKTHQLADAALGLSGVGKHRLERVEITPATGPSPFHTSPIVWDETIVFRPNPNPFGTTIQVDSAKADCFLILKALYTHNLPLGRITLIGRFRFPDARHEVTVLRAVSTGKVESALAPWKGLGRSAEKRVWVALDSHWMSRAFRRYIPGKS